MIKEVEPVKLVQMNIYQSNTYIQKRIKLATPRQRATASRETS